MSTSIPQKPFRFGVVNGPYQGRERWVASARRAEELGFSTLLSPDGLHALSTFPALAVAATVTTRLRVGTFVAASPLRTPRAAAWDAHSLTVLSDGRFEMGIGTGIPAAREWAAELGLPYGSGAERLQQVADTIRHLRELDKDQKTPVLMATGGPKSRALAAEVADIVTLAAGPLSGRDELAEMAESLREAAGDRAADIELAMNIFVVGDDVPAWTREFIKADIEQLKAHDSMTLLRGTVTEMADELQRRREQIGVSYVSVNSAFMEQFAPVVERLTGR
jgi:probable F420-dependent oxidoreductase